MILLQIQIQIGGNEQTVKRSEHDSVDSNKSDSETSKLQEIRSYIESDSNDNESDIDKRATKRQAIHHHHRQNKEQQQMRSEYYLLRQWTAMMKQNDQHRTTITPNTRSTKN